MVLFGFGFYSVLTECLCNKHLADGNQRVLGLIRIWRFARSPPFEETLYVCGVVADYARSYPRGLESSSRLTALDRAQRDQKRLAEVLACEVGFLVRIHYVEHLRLLLIIKQAKTTTFVKIDSN